MREFKKCNKCREWFIANTEYFKPQKGNKDGLRGECRSCRAEYEKIAHTLEYKESRVKEEEYLLTAKTKECNSCGETFPRTSEYFHIREDTKYGFRNECKSCTGSNRQKYVSENKELVSEDRKQYRLNNLEIFTEKDKKYRTENHGAIVDRKKVYWIKNKVALTKKNRKYYKENTESISSQQKIYYQNNIEYFAISNKQWRTDHPEEQRITNERRRSRVRNLRHTFTTAQWKEAKIHFDHRCAFCDEEVPLTMEHVACVTKGGEFTRDNIIPSCKSCNSKKRTQDCMAWFRGQPAYTLAKENKILLYLGYKNNRQQLALF